LTFFSLLFLVTFENVGKDEPWSAPAAGLAQHRRRVVGVPLVRISLVTVEFSME
jgi:hypothetical protein